MPTPPQRAPTKRAPVTRTAASTRAASKQGSTHPQSSGPPPVARLLNLGEKSSAWLASVGISEEASLRALGAAEAFRRVKATFPRQVSWVLLYALHGALTRTHWNEFPPEVKAQMRAEVAHGGTPRRTPSP
jgi:DNA transformation protein